jgi:ADP-heptose:LPS heptosyltransferase
MPNQPGLKITAQGVVPDWFPQAIDELKKRKGEAKQDERRDEQRDFITRKKILFHFSAAEDAGTWSGLTKQEV